METPQEAKHRESLITAMENWLEAHSSGDDPLCYVGNNTAVAMANAAFAVMQGMADLEAYFESESMLTH
jgi:hypothetical protein